MDEEGESDAFWALALAAEEDTLRAHAAAAASSSAAAPPAAPAATAAGVPAPRPPPPPPPPSVLAAEDSYSRLLREKDAELRRVVLEKDGEIANLRHRMRALSSRLEARPPPPPRPQPPAYAPVAAHLADERARLVKDVSIAQADLGRVSEQLLFAQQEIAALHEREQRRAAASAATASCAAAAAAAAAAAPAAATAAVAVAAAVEPPPPQAQPGSQSPSPSAADFPDPGTLGSAPVPSANGGGGECVEPTQLHQVYEMSRREPRRPRRRRRPNSASGGGDPASSSFAGTPNAVSPTQALSRVLLSAEEMPPPAAAPLPPRTPRGGGKRLRTPERDGDGGRDLVGEAAEVHVVWSGGGDAGGGGGDGGECAALREALFGEERAERLLRLCDSLGKRELRQAIARAMASDQEWVLLLPPLGDLVRSGGGAAHIALTAIGALVEHNKESRVALATSLPHAPVVAEVLRALEGATAVRDAHLSSLALRIMSCTLSEISLVDDDGGGDKPEVAVATRRRLEHDAVLLWLQQHEPEMVPACAAAAEIASELIVNIIGTPVAQHDQREGDFLEQAVLCFAAALPVLTVDATVKNRALCSLDWTSRVAPYFLDEKEARVMESVCLFIVDVVHRMRLRRMLQRDADKSFCALLEADEASGRSAAPQCWDLVRSSDEDRAHIAAVTRAVSIARRLVQRGPAGDALATEVTPATRNVALGTLAFLAWPDVDPKTQRYPAPQALHAHQSLANDAQTVYAALLRTEVTH